jgi:hypothetical protein
MGLHVGNKWAKVGKTDYRRPIVDSNDVKVIADAVALNAFASSVGLAAAVNAVVPTANGDGTGVIPDEGALTICTVNPSNADHIVTLPTPTPGKIVVLMNIAANTAYELRSSDPATVLIGEGTGGAAVESAIPAKSVCVMFCISATKWSGLTINAATLAAVAAAAT